MSRAVVLRLSCVTRVEWCDDCLRSHLWLRAYRLDQPDRPPMIDRGVHEP